MENELLHELFTKYHKQLYLFILAIVHDGAAAEDILQDAFLKALLYVPDDILNLRAWLYTVAKNLSLNYLKKSSGRVSLDDLPEVPVEDSALKRLLEREQNQRLYAAMSALSLPKRQVLTLQYFSGLSQRETAAVLGLSAENVRVLSHRAKKDLKTILEEKP